MDESYKWSRTVRVGNQDNERKISDKEISLINELRNKNYTIKRICELVGYSRSTVYKYLERG